MSRMICLDTSTKCCSVAIINPSGVEAEKTLIEEGYVHAEQLHVLIQDVLSEAGLKSAELAAVAVGSGPGSYTGLRIGVSAAKGLAYAVGIPLIAIPSLQIIASAAQASCSDAHCIRPMIDARRMEVFSQAYSPALEAQDECQAHIIDEESFCSELDQGLVYFCGDGMAKCKAILGGHENARFADDVHPLASAMYPIARQKFEAKDYEDVAYFEPFYLKEFVAKKSKPML